MRIIPVILMRRGKVLVSLIGATWRPRTVFSADSPEMARGCKQDDGYWIRLPATVTEQGVRCGRGHAEAYEALPGRRSPPAARPGLVPGASQGVCQARPLDTPFCDSEEALPAVG